MYMEALLSQIIQVSSPQFMLAYQTVAILAIPTSTSSTFGLSPFRYSHRRLKSLTLNSLSFPSTQTLPLGPLSSLFRDSSAFWAVTGLMGPGAQVSLCERSAKNERDI